MSVLLHSANMKLCTPSLLVLTAHMNYEGFISVVKFSFSPWKQAGDNWPIYSSTIMTTLEHHIAGFFCI